MAAKHFVKMKSSDVYHSIQDLVDNEQFVSYEAGKPCKQSITFPIYNPQDQKYYASSKLLHTLVDGPTGAGKTSCVFNVQISSHIDAGGSFCAIGSPDLLDGNYNYAKEHDYKVYTLNFENLSQSNAYNYLQGIYKMYHEGTPEGFHRAISNMRASFEQFFTSNGKTVDEYWEHSSEKTASGAGCVLLKKAPLSEVNLPNITRLVEDIMNHKSAAERYYEQYQDDIPGMSLLSTILHAPDKTASSIQVTFSEKMTFFTQDPLIEHIFSHHEFPDFSTIANQKVGLFVILPFHSTKLYMPIVKMFLLDLIQGLTSSVKKLNDEQAKRFLICCDEFPSYAFLEIGTYIANSRKYNIQWSLGLQSPSQLDKFGMDFKQTILDNCLVKIHLAMNNPQAIKEVSESSGYKTIYYENRSVRKNNISVDDLTQMPMGSAIIQYGSMIIFDYLVPYYKMPHLSHVLPYFPRRVLTKYDLEASQHFSFIKNMKGYY